MTDRISMFRPIVFAFAFGLAVLGLDNSVCAEDDAPLHTRAARLTYLQGMVTVDQADNTASLPAQLNLPLLAGVRLATGDDGQAEVEFEDGSLVRLTPNSVLALDNLTVEPAGAREMQGVFTTGLSLLHGLAYLELRSTPQYRYTLNAGGDILSPVENTTVRVNFDEPPAIFAVLDGTARVERQSGMSGAGYQREVRAGESLRGDTADPSAYSLTSEIAENSWDQWNEDRDRTATAEAARRTGVRDNYAGAQGYGWSDLDANGSWYDVPGQGSIWQPQIAVADASFDPYGNGAWAWYPGTGYLWASGYAWGWTPYRCGSWSYFNGFGWGWAPGAGCGGFGWGFAGGGRPVNIALVPRGYLPVRVPIADHGPQRPLLRVHVNPTAERPMPSTFVQAGPRRIAGVTALPIEPVGSGFTVRGGTAGSSLHRDFPIDAVRHTPVVGLTSTQPVLVHSSSGWHSTGERPAGVHPGYTGQAVPSYRGPSGAVPAVRTAPSYEPAPSPVQQSAPVQQTVPVQHSSPPPPPPPPPSPSHPTYAPAPAPSPNRSAPR